MHYITSTLLGIAALGYALPQLTPSGPGLARRQDNKNPADSCPPTIDEQGDDSFKKSGAEQWLSNYLTDPSKKAWDGGNWLHKLDVETTGDGNFHGGKLDCSATDGTSCKPTDVNCSDFTPPQMWWVRQAAVGAHGYFTRSHEQLQDGVISADLGTDQMAQDFDVGEMKEDKGPLIAAILFAVGTILPFANEGLKAAKVAASLTDRVTQAASAAGAAGGAVNLRNNIGSENTPKTPFELATAAQNVLKSFFDTMRNDQQLTLHQIFAGVGEGEEDKVATMMDMLQKMGVQKEDVHPAAFVLSHGGFLKPSDENGLKNLMDKALNVVKHQMIGAILAAQQVVVFQNTNGEEKYCTERGNRWFDDSCWDFRHMKIDGDGLASDDKLKEDTIKNLESYGIDVQQVYENVRDCGNDFRTPELQLTYDGPYPRCAFGLSHFKADDEPCNFWPPTKGLAFEVCESDGPFFDCDGPVIYKCPPGDRREWWKKFKNGEDVKFNGWYDN